MAKKTNIDGPYVKGDDVPLFRFRRGGYFAPAPSKARSSAQRALEYEASSVGSNRGRYAGARPAQGTRRRGESIHQSGPDARGNLSACHGPVKAGSEVKPCILQVKDA